MPPPGENPDPDGPREPEAQRQSFRLPVGFTAELVASEAQGLNKPITVSWDRHGRMWTMTAVEYPVDANEDREAAEALFAAGVRGGGAQYEVINSEGALGDQCVHGRPNLPKQGQLSSDCSKIQ